jgi:hypothetical protein
MSDFHDFQSAVIDDNPIREIGHMAVLSVLGARIVMR